MMKLQIKSLLIFSLLLILTTCQNATKPHPRYIKKIMNGIELDSTLKTPWVVSITGTSEIQESFHCTGTLISSRYVVTAGHCFVRDGVTEPKTSYYWIPTVRLWDNVEGCDGKDLIVPDNVRESFIFKFNTDCRKNCDSIDTMFRKAKKIILPGMCNRTIEPFWFKTPDFAIVELFEAVPLFDYVYPANISNENPEFDIGTQVTVAGYGLDTKDNKSGKLKFYVTNGVIKCSQSKFSLPITDWFCVKSLPNTRKACEGDSGAGAIVTRGGVYKVIGILSRGSGCTTENVIGKVSFIPIYKHLADICKYARICF